MKIRARDDLSTNKWPTKKARHSTPLSLHARILLEPVYVTIISGYECENNVEHEQNIIFFHWASPRTITSTRHSRNGNQ
jgi:hypothetical protein